MELALRREGIEFKREIETDLCFQGEKIGKYRLDFLIDKRVVLELKTVPVVGREDYRQVKAYLKSTGLRLGIIANFRGPRLQYKRILNSDAL